jgi:hypothetical protein
MGPIQDRLPVHPRALEPSSPALPNRVSLVIVQNDSKEGPISMVMGWSDLSTSGSTRRKNFRNFLEQRSVCYPGVEARYPGVRKCRQIFYRMPRKPRMAKNLMTETLPTGSLLEGYDFQDRADGFV